MKNSDIPTELKQAICSNKLIVFVGAGLSYNLINIKNQQLKGWSNLVEQILHDLKQKGYEVDVLVPLISKYEPIKILDLIESDTSISKKDIYSFIKDYLDLDDNKNNYKLHKKLYKLSRKIITTNYDTAFERAIPELRKNKAYKGKNYELTTHKDPNSTLLFKLHGCFEDVDSMVLFPENYDSLYKNAKKDAEHSISVLKNIVYNNSVLFVGTGMGDFQINNLFSEIKKIEGEYNQKHFIITNKNLDSSLSFLTALSVKNYTEIEKIIDLLNSIKEECETSETSEIIALRKQLLEANKKLEEIDLKKIDTQEKLLEREALKYFSSGIEFHLSNKYEKALTEYKTAVELNPDLYEALYNWGLSLEELAKNREGNEAEDLYYQAIDKYKKIIELKPDYHRAIGNFGVVLANLAKNKNEKKKVELLNIAIEKFKMVLKLKPNKHIYFYNWGKALNDLASTKKGGEELELVNQAVEKFQMALEMQPNDYDSFIRLGNTFGYLAVLQKDKILIRQYFEQAITNFERASKIDPLNYEAFDGWGLALEYLAKVDANPSELYRKAIEKHRKSYELESNYTNSLFNWGKSLGKLAEIESGQKAIDLYMEAIEIMEKLIKIEPENRQAIDKLNTFRTGLDNVQNSANGT